MRGLLSALLLTALLGDGAAAQPALSDAAKAMLGTWEFSNADREKMCAVTFRAEPAAGGMRVEFERKCTSLFPFIGEVASSRSLAAAPIAQNARIPMLTPSSTNPEVTKKGDFIFRSCFIDPYQGAAIAQFAAKTLGAKTAAIMVDRKNDYSTGLEKVIDETFTKFGGKIVATQSYQEGDQDFNAQLTSLKGSNPDVIFVPGYYNDVGLIAKQARDKGITVPLIGGDGWDSEQLYKIGGTALNGSYFTNHYSPYDTEPKVQKFVNDYKSRYGSTPDALAATAYDAANIMFDAIKRSKSLSGPDIRDALAATNAFPGVTGTVTFNQNRDAVKPIVMIEIKDGGTYAVKERFNVEGAAVASNQ